MTFLSELEKYINRYRPTLSKLGYSEVHSSDGTGMGAVITFAKGTIEFDLTNDRGQYFVYLRRSNDRKNYFDLNVFQVMGEIQKDKKDIFRMPYEEKKRYWEISYSYSDPLVELLRHLEIAEKALQEGEMAKTKLWTKEYYRKRGDWLFPKKAKKS